MHKQNINQDNTFIKSKHNLTLDEILGINADNKIMNDVKKINNINKEINKDIMNKEMNAHQLNTNIDYILNNGTVKFDNKMQSSMFFVDYKSINIFVKNLKIKYNINIKQDIIDEHIIQNIPKIIKEYTCNLKKRSKKFINIEYICLGRKLDNKQCTRKKHNGTDFCKSHLIKLSNGRIDELLQEIIRNKRGRKRKVEFDPRQYDNEYITLWEDIINGHKVLLDSNNNIYTYDLKGPQYLGKKKIDTNIDLLLNKNKENNDVKQKGNSELELEKKQEVNLEVDLEVNLEVNPSGIPKGNSELEQERTPEVNPEVNLEVKPSGKPGTQIEMKLEGNPEKKIEGKPDVKPEVNPEKNPEVTPEGKPEVKPAGNPEVKSEVKPEVKSEVKPTGKPEGKSEVKPTGKTEVKPEVKPTGKPEVKPGRKLKANIEVKPAEKLEGIPEVNPEKNPEVTPEGKPEYKKLKNKTNKI